MKRDEFTPQIDSGRDSAIELNADQLFANWGFGDGEMLEEHPAYLSAVAETGACLHPRDALALLIQRYLLPALPMPLRTYRLKTTCHNPVRADDDELHRRSEFDGFSVSVTHAQIVELLREHVPKTAPMGARRHITARSSAPRVLQQSLPFTRELIIDNFAGGGGTSTGLEAAFGRPVDIAINHDPEALAMHALNHPHTKHLCESVWDVDPVEVTKNQPVGLVWLSPDCFPAGTLVLTRTGYRAIETIQVGDDVLTHRGRWRPVTALMSGMKETSTIRAQGHPGITCSSGHKFWARKSKHAAPDWIPANQLRRGAYLASPKVIARIETPALHPKHDVPGFWWIIGRYLADGWASPAHGLILAVGAAKASATAERLSSSGLNWKRRETATAVHYVHYDADLCRWIEQHFGRLASGKTLPGWVLGQAEAVRRELLAGYVAGDGFEHDGLTEISTGSSALAYGIRSLAETLGNTCRVYSGLNRNTKIGDRVILAKLPMFKVRWREVIASDHRQTTEDELHRWYPVRAISISDKREVFNITVDEDHSYIVEGIVAKNCKHFSKAKGGTPVSKNIRGLAWVTLRWLLKTSPRVFMIENVEEFVTWGELLEVEPGKWIPDPTKKGETFRAFIGMITKGVAKDHPALAEACEMLGIELDSPDAMRLIKGLGYAVAWKEMRACDSGAPTIRKRLFIVGRRDGLPIVFPAATHGAPSSANVLAGLLKPYRTAAECIDFGLPAESVFGRKRPLVRNTMRRVAKGLWRHVLTNGNPFIVGAGGPVYSGKPTSVDQPLGTLTTENHRALVAGALTPFLTEHANASNQRTMAADEPLRTLCAQVKGGHFSVVAPMLSPLRGTSESHLGGHDVQEPLSTVSAGGTHHALVQGHLVMTNTTGHPGASPDKPLATVTTGGHHALVAAHLTHLTHHGERAGLTPDNPLPTITGAHRGEQAMVGAHLVTIGYGERDGQQPRAQDIVAPLGTVVTANKHALVASHLTKFRTGSEGQSLDKPMPTITANSYIKRPGGAAPLGIVAAHLVDMGHGEGACGTKRFSHGIRSLEVPLNTVTASGAPSALAAACLEQANGGFYDGDGRAADDPMSTITSSGSNQRLITAYLVQYYSDGGQDSSCGLPMGTVTTKARMGLVQTTQIPAAALPVDHTDRARCCAELLHEHLPDQFPEAAELVLMWHQGQWWVLVDITLRMLKPKELYPAQGFPRSYQFEKIPDPSLLFVGGKQSVENPLLIPRISLSATAQVRMVGNSVSPPMAEALVLANFAHEAEMYGEAA